MRCVRMKLRSRIGFCIGFSFILSKKTSLLYSNQSLQNLQNIHRPLMQQKLHQALNRGYFRTVDLFAGCGGMTLGFHRAGFKCVSAVEIDPDAAKSHKLNFAPLAQPEGYAIFNDITKTSPEQAVAHLEEMGADEGVDILVGGPPCQAFSRLGRAALWRLAGKDKAHADDHRATMYHHYLHYLDTYKPLAFVMENVREIGKFVGRNLAEEIACSAEELGYEVRYTLLNAVWYGVPQLRERAIMIGIHKELGQVPKFPKITHQYSLPTGYSTSRAGQGHVEFIEPHDHYVDHLDFSSKTSPAVSVKDAFVDLPPIFSHLAHKTSSKKPRNPDNRYDYVEGANPFTSEMRAWPHFRNGATSFSGHIIRYTPRDYETFKRMPHGGMYPEALETAHQIFAERLKRLEADLGKQIKEGSKEWTDLFKATVPPYKPGRYPNKFRKMWPNQPSRTLPAHIGKDAYSHIHFDSKQARGISLREAARIQSFPDGFKFAGSMNAQLKQIGNAVPPLLAYSIAKSLKKSLLASNVCLSNSKV